MSDSRIYWTIIKTIGSWNGQEVLMFQSGFHGMFRDAGSEVLIKLAIKLNLRNHFLE